MNARLSLVFLLLGSISGWAAEAAAPRFENLASFLSWADKKLTADDYDALITAQADSKDTRETKLASIQKLDADIGKQKLAKIFEGRVFPKDATTFTLGGHKKELGHCHIDFSKDGDSWRIAGIWQCR
ncbi:MAG: hypothetical protein ABIQ96_06800 [Luteolibacter sp.]